MSKLFTKAEIERTDKGLLAVASTAVEDRHGEVVSVGGWDLKNFKKNPVMLWAHDHYQPAIGTAKNMKVDGEGKKAKLVFEPVFHDKTPMAAALKSMVDDGIINSFSVGFRPLEMDGNTYTSQELLEVSLVNVPANPEARLLAMKSMEQAKVDKEVIDEIFKSNDEEVDPEPNPEIEVLRATVESQQEQINDLVKGLKHLNPVVDTKKAVSRLTYLKAVARASDRLLESKPKGNNASLLKVIKRSTDHLINDTKQDLKFNGKN